MKPLYAFQDVKVVDKDVKDVDRKFQERLVAGRMAVSRLVIHLAAAATIVRQEYLKRGVAVGLDDLLERRDLIEEIVRRSELLHPLAIRAPKLGVTSAELVRVRLV